MLRGKFGQIGKEFRDGHITMDAFEQAAFRDHIRAGERIMYLASMGKLKHKRTRNTIAAEPTPRSSCPSNADATAPHAARAAASDPRAAAARNNTSNDANRASDPAPQGATKVARLGSAPPGVPGLEAIPVEPQHGKKHAEDVRDSSPTSHSRLLVSAVYRREPDLDRDNPSASETPAAGRPRARVTPSNGRGLGSVRPESTGPVCRRTTSQSFGAVGNTAQGDTTENPRADGIPLQVGPEITAPSADLARACAGLEERSTAARRRPASAGGVAAAHRNWRAAQQHPTRIVHRGFGGQGRGGAARNGGRGGGRDDPNMRGKRGGIASPTSNARGPCGEATVRTTEGSFAQSVIKSARPFADYDNTLPSPTKEARPNSAGAATATAPAPAFHPGSQQAHALAAGTPLAAGTRVMPVGAIHKAFKGRCLAAVQAWDPLAAAAVRAARAETLLRRKLPGRAGRTGAPAPAAASRRRSGVLGVVGRHRDESPGCRDQSEGARRLGLSSLTPRGDQTHGNNCRQNGKERGGNAVNNALRKEFHRERVPREFAAAIPAFDGPSDGGREDGSEQGRGDNNLTLKELDKPSGSSCRGSTAGSARGSARSNSGATLSTARASSATGRSSRGSGSATGRCGSQRNASTTSHNNSCSASSSDDIAAEERRARLLAELETLRRRMADAEGRLREVDSCLRSKPKKRPGTATSRPTTKTSGRGSSSEARASLATTPGDTSAKSSAGYGAFNLGERRMSPLVVSHPANAFPDKL